MTISELNSLSTKTLKAMPWLLGINSYEQYQQLITLMGELVEDYDSYRPLITLLFPIIERYEENSEHFAEFNKEVAAIPAEVAMLRVIMDQNNLTPNDFPELGDNVLISLILKGKKELTPQHIAALSERFKIPTNMFI